LIVLSSPTARLSRILRIFGLFFSSKPLTYLGMYSYSIYLWHLPLILLLNRFWSEGSPNLFEFFIILSLVALLSFNFVEKPLQSRILKRWVNTSNRRSPSNS
jgi:peptidoglycan/LPS O-acetylase OafA/YrhL